MNQVRSEHDAVVGPFTHTASLAEEPTSDRNILAKFDLTRAVMKEAR